MIRLDEREMVGKYLGEIINAELTNYLERKPYKRKEEQTNYRKGHSKGGVPSYFVRDGELMNVKM